MYYSVNLKTEEDPKNQSKCKAESIEHLLQIVQRIMANSLLHNYTVKTITIKREG